MQCTSARAHREREEERPGKASRHTVQSQCLIRCAEQEERSTGIQQEVRRQARCPAPPQELKRTWCDEHHANSDDASAAGDVTKKGSKVGRGRAVRLQVDLPRVLEEIAAEALRNGHCCEAANAWRAPAVPACPGRVATGMSLLRQIILLTLQHVVNMRSTCKHQLSGTLIPNIP
jgi:hypothetical protein